MPKHFRHFTYTMICHAGTE